MKANELRIGNIVDWPNEGAQTISGGRLYELMRNSTLLINTKPIPLTEEWLIRFGARPFQSGFIIDKYPHMEYFLWSNAYNIFVWQRCEARLRGIEYVHQLQNLYFALTGEELTIKEL